MIRVALSKGRILKQTLPLLEEVGLRPIEDPFTSRKLILASNRDDVEFVVIRATDVPTYVQFGAADMGVVGKDGLMEHGAEGLCELLDLQISQCRLMTAVPKAGVNDSGASNSESGNSESNNQGQKKRLRVATKYVNLAQQYYQSKGIQAELIKLYGAMELAPLVGLADEIVDLVETGNTLKANGLEAKELIANISCRLIANAASMRVKHEEIDSLAEQLQAVVQSKSAQVA